MKGFLQTILQEIIKKNNTWNIRCLVDDSFVPSSKRPSVLYCKLTDFWTRKASERIVIGHKEGNHWVPIFSPFFSLVKFGLSEKHTKFEKIFLMVLTHEEDFFKLCVLLQKSKLSKGGLILEDIFYLIPTSHFRFYGNNCLSTFQPFECFKFSNFPT